MSQTSLTLTMSDAEARGRLSTLVVLWQADCFITSERLASKSRTLMEKKTSELTSRELLQAARCVGLREIAHGNFEATTCCERQNLIDNFVSWMQATYPEELKTLVYWVDEEMREENRSHYENMPQDFKVTPNSIDESVLLGGLFQ